MSKVGIVTLPLRLNYGGILQAYALQTVLERLGNEVDVIQPRHRNYSVPKGVKAPIVYCRRAFFKLFGLSDTPVFAEKQLNEQWPVITAHTQQFIRKYIHVKEVLSYDDLNSKDYDMLVVGSDQVWRPLYSNLCQCYLQFADGWKVKRIAYAASFGTDEKEYTEEQIEKCGYLLGKFDAVSVREDSGIGLCKDYFGISAQHVLDPTLLLDKADYIELVGKSGIGHSGGDLFAYILDSSDEKKSLVDRIATERHLTPFSVKAKNDYKYAPLEDRIQPPVEQWLSGFMDAEMVVTDSFHGCAFSILFNKPFIAVGNSDRGLVRFTSLLESFGLNDRLNAYDFNSMGEIDWERVNEKLLDLRKKSQDFLTASFQN